MMMKFIRLSILVILGLAASISYGDYVCGDANSDGKLNVSDAVYLINYVFSGGSAPDPYCCDVCPPEVTDYDGNVYPTILIGDQCWMLENLKVTHYRNGNAIDNITGNNDWVNLTSGAYCDYANDDANSDIYGRLYNGYAITDSRNIAPRGWHLPSDDEWKELEMYLGMSQTDADASNWRGTDEGGKLKEVGTIHWNDPNTGATNSSGFTALPSGYRDFETGQFKYLFYTTNFWSTTEFSTGSMWRRGLMYSNSQIYRDYHNKHYGFPVRCIKD